MFWGRIIFRKRAIVALLALSSSFLIMMAGCGSGTPDAGPAGGKTIRIGYIAADQLHSPALMVMKEKKLLEAAGFKTEWHEYIAGAYAIQDMASDNIDYACCGVVPVVINQSQGLDLAIIAGSNQEGSSLVVTDSIKTIMDLDGMTVATPGLGSIQDAMLVRLAAENNININRTTMDVSDMPDFLKQKEIDGFFAWAPHPDNAAEQKLGHQLISSRDIMPNHQCCVLVTKSEIVEEDQETVEKLLEIYLDAYKWFLENRDESMKMIAKATGVKEAVVRSAFAGVCYSYPPYCNTESMKGVTRGLIGAGRIPAMEEAAIDDFIDGIYRPELMETIAAR